jgi:hypothetical protein
MFTRSSSVQAREVRCKLHGLVVWRDESCVLCRASRRDREKRRRAVTMLTVFTLALGASALFLRERGSMVHVAEVTAAWVSARAEHPVGERHAAAASMRKPAQRVLTSAPVTRREP